MGGRIWVESEAGKGSTFHFTASFALVTSRAVVAAVPDAVDLRALPVLVVDDNATNRRLLEGMLIGWDMVADADGGHARCARARCARPTNQDGRSSSCCSTSRCPMRTASPWRKRSRSDPALAGATIVMLTSAGQPGDAARCREVGVGGYLLKPIKARSCAPRSSWRWVATPVNGIGRRWSRATLCGRRATPGRILLVEDNSVNQLVARRLLERRGHTVVVANNGREALAILEACGVCRVQLRAHGRADAGNGRLRVHGHHSPTGSRRLGSHVPIVAMTAHAMKGDDERCLAAGMDAYLSKPIQPDDFFEVIERHLQSLITNP